MINANILDVNEANFIPDVIERSRRQPVIVDFWAPWCGPCRMLSPILERVTTEANGAFVLAKINSDNNQRLAQQYGVQGIPAVKVFRDGKVVGEFVGAQPEPKVREFLKKYAPAKSDLALTAAQALVSEGRLSEAETALHNIMSAKPDHNEAAMTLGKVLLRLGRGAEAITTFETIPSSAKESAVAERLLPLAQLLNQTEAVNDGSDAQYQAAADLTKQGRYVEAMDALLAILRKNRTSRNGAAKQSLLAMFELLGDDPLVKDYRRQLANVLF
ncbi:MAG: thioredoxin [Chloroflexi bacterium]|nr:thioredoxin [Chloroflexota bacterium]